ncbi:MAG TPA: hypothetical protein VGN97_01620 [Mesorhizobium sp.]|jgi:hypothetical protein|nr:hypothetical protein [Mesorhizobium sp.]
MSSANNRPQGNKTHQQFRNIVENRVDTSNAGEDFDIRADLNRSDAEKRARQEGANLRADHPDFENADDRAMIRGENQSSQHHKNRVDDD